MKPIFADDAAIDYAAGLLRQGRLVAFPTETVYGLGADASNPDAVRRILRIKFQLGERLMDAPLEVLAISATGTQYFDYHFISFSCEEITNNKHQISNNIKAPIFNY